MLDNLTISGIIIAVLLSATVLRFIYSDGRRAKRTPDGAHPVIEGNAMKTMTGSDELDLVDGAADETKPVEPWNGLHLGVVAEVYHRFRPAPGAVDKDEPWNNPKLGSVAEVYGWCDPDPFASHRRAMRRAGLTFVSSAPNARTKPKPIQAL